MTCRSDLYRGRRVFLSSLGRMSVSLMIANALPIWSRAFASGRAVLERTAFAMGTTVKIAAYGESRGQLIEATSEAFAELYRLDRLLSVFRPASDVSRLNAAEVDEPVRVAPATMAALVASGRFHAMTEGRFDATVGGLLSVLGFHEEDPPTDRTIADRQLADAKEGIGWHHVRFDADGTVRRLHPSTRVDLGGIGAGFAVDRMGEMLRRRGVEAALIDHSGDLLAIGAPPESDGWVVSIADPEVSDRSLMQLTLRDRAVSTSTNARSIRSIGSRAIGHIIEPSTGENPQRQVCVSVLAPSSIEADALSTALFVDAQPGGAWQNGHREAILVRPDGREHVVESLR